MRRVVARESARRKIAPAAASAAGAGLRPAAGVPLAGRDPARLLAVTSNPTAPAGPPLPPARLFEALRAEASAAPVFDLVADLQSDR